MNMYVVRGHRESDAPKTGREYFVVAPDGATAIDRASQQEPDRDDTLFEVIKEVAASVDGPARVIGYGGTGEFRD